MSTIQKQWTRERNTSRGDKSASSVDLQVTYFTNMSLYGHKKV